MNSKIAINQLKELEKLGKNMRLAAEDWDTDWKVLIATLLSARTRDETTIKVSENLFKKYASLKSLSKASLSNIQKMIKPVNFYRNKSKSILGCVQSLIKNHNGIVPYDIDELIKLQGVGRKTANVFLAVSNKPAIGVDTHIAYISQRLGWTKNKNPHKIEKDLQELFPKNFWNKINYIVVRFGRTYTSKKKKDGILDKIKQIK